MEEEKEKKKKNVFLTCQRFSRNNSQNLYV